MRSMKRRMATALVLLASASLLAAPLAVLQGTAAAPAGPAAQQDAPVFESADYEIKDGTGPAVAGGVAYLFAGDDPWAPPGVDSSIVALDASDGSLLWQQNLEWAGGMGSKARPLVEGDGLFIGCGKSVYRLDTANLGAVMWQTDITPAGGSLGDPVILSDPVAYDGPGGTRVVVVGDFIYGAYVGLDASDGEILWRYSLDAGSSASGTPGVDDDGRRLYLPQSAAFGFPVNGKIKCIDVSGAGAPALAWEYSAQYDVAGSVAFHQGHIFFSDFAYGGPESNFYRVEDEGTRSALSWQQPIWGSSGLPLVNPASGTVYVCGNDYSVGGNHFYAFDLDSGDLAWDNPNRGAYNGNCALSATTGYLYAGSFDTTMWAHNQGIGAVDPFTGSELWLVSGKGGGDPVISDGLVYTTADGRLYAYDEFVPTTFDWYFAEGYTGDGFEEWLCLANPGDTAADDASVEVTYLFNGGGAPLVRNYAVPAGSRVTVSVNGAVGPGAEVSMQVVSDKPVVAERPMYFNYRGAWTGGSCVVGADRPLSKWYFAEGYTGDGFEEWLCLMNPEATATTAKVTYYYGDGSDPKEKDWDVAANSRLTLDVNAEGGAGKDVSIKVETAASKPIVAERPMYFNYNGEWTGGHCVVGAGEARNKWYFAEGYTGDGFNEWLCLLNPGDTDASVDVSFLYQGEAVVVKDYSVPANSRRTLNINEEAGNDKQLGIEVASSQPVLAERPIYFNYAGKWTGGSCVVGAELPSNYWVLAEGYTSPDFDQYICISNPGKEKALVTVAPLFASGGAAARYEVEAGQRCTVTLRSDESVERAYAVTSDRGVVVERPMYFDYQGMGSHGWTGGHCTLGATLRDIY